MNRSAVNEFNTGESEVFTGSGSITSTVNLSGVPLDQWKDVILNAFDQLAVGDAIKFIECESVTWVRHLLEAHRKTELSRIRVKCRSRAGRSELILARS